MGAPDGEATAANDKSAAGPVAKYSYVQRLGTDLLPKARQRILHIGLLMQRDPKVAPPEVL